MVPTNNNNNINNNNVDIIFAQKLNIHKFVYKAKKFELENVYIYICIFNNNN